MKKLLMFIAIVVQSSACIAYNQVRLVINDGIDNQQLKQRMEQAVSAVMTEINRSHEQNLTKLTFPDSYINKEAQEGLNQLWKNDHMRCVEEEIVELLIALLLMK